MKKTFRYETKVRKPSGSLLSSIPSPIALLLGIEKGDKLIWEFNRDEEVMKVFLKEKSKD